MSTSGGGVRPSNSCTIASITAGSMKGWSPCTFSTTVSARGDSAPAPAKATRASRAEASRSLPELQFGEVSRAGNPQRSAASTRAGLSAQSTTAAGRRAWAQRSSTRCSMGRPPMSAMTFPGNRDESRRAGTATTNRIVAPSAGGSLSSPHGAGDRHGGPPQQWRAARAG